MSMLRVREAGNAAAAALLLFLFFIFLKLEKQTEVVKYCLGCTLAGAASPRDPGQGTCPGESLPLPSPGQG